MSQKRLLLILPHDKVGGGASSYPLPAKIWNMYMNTLVNGQQVTALPKKISEHEWARVVLPLIKDEIEKQFPGKVDTLILDRLSGYSSMRRKCNRYFNSVDVDLAFENHYNGGSDPASNGSEMLVEYEDHATIDKTYSFMEQFAAEFGLRLRHDRGVKKLKNRDRGDYCLEMTEDISAEHVLFEPMYATHESTACRIFEDPDKYAALVARLICEVYLGLKKIVQPELPLPVQPQPDCIECLMVEKMQLDLDELINKNLQMEDALGQIRSILQGI